MKTGDRIGIITYYCGGSVEAEGDVLVPHDSAVYKLEQAGMDLGELIISAIARQKPVEVNRIQVVSCDDPEFKQLTSWRE